MSDLHKGDDLDRVVSYRREIRQHGISPDEKEDQNRLTVGQRDRRRNSSSRRTWHGHLRRDDAL